MKKIPNKEKKKQKNEQKKDYAENAEILLMTNLIRPAPIADLNKENTEKK